VTIFLGKIDRDIAFDPTLKNDAQRKVRRQELMETDANYFRATLDLKNAQDKRTSLDIQLQLLRNEFSVLKLERREAIAQLELQAVS
jgi:hypothetical protein